MVSAQQGLQYLRDGNHRFATDNCTRPTAGQARRDELQDGQAPFAAIIGCSDSRVPVEIVFDQHLGDIFSVRVVGEVTEPSVIASVEFAAELLGTRLVVVLGHSSCGAVTAAVEQLQQPSTLPSPNLRAVVDEIQPGIQDLVTADDGADQAALIERAVRANVNACVEQLRRGSRILERLADEDGLSIIGAEYSLVTGRVEFFDGAT